MGYETKDANTYAAWGVDYLKFDSCYADATPTDVEYGKMRDALNATGRPIFYSLCGMYIHILSIFLILFDIFSIAGGLGPWAPSTGNSWRTTTDIGDYWELMISNLDNV